MSRTPTVHFACVAVAVRYCIATVSSDAVCYCCTLLHTVPLSSSSINWYWPKGSDSLRFSRSGMCHWQSWNPHLGSLAVEREMNTRPTRHRGVWSTYFSLRQWIKFRICNMVGCVCASAGLIEIPVASGVFTCCEFLMLSASALRAVSS